MILNNVINPSNGTVAKTNTHIGGSNKVVYIKSNINASFVLDAGSGRRGTQVQLTRLNNSPGQQWFFTDDGYVQSALKAADGSDLVLGVEGANKVVISSWFKNGADAQKWILNAHGNLVSKLNYYVLDGPFSADGTSPSTPQLFLPNGTVTQKWSVNNIGKPV